MGKRHPVRPDKKKDTAARPCSNVAFSHYRPAMSFGTTTELNNLGNIHIILMGQK
jgi:hypothetical protein